MHGDFAITRQQARELDRATIAEVGVKGLILMENAGRACALEGARMLLGAPACADGSPAGDLAGNRVAVFCGLGNNGGDGFVVARHLHNWGADVRTCLLGGVTNALLKGGDAAVNLEIALNMDIPVHEAAGPTAVREFSAQCRGSDLVVDALLGTGLDRPVEEPYRAAVKAVRAVGSPVLAVDVPSGLDCDTGRALGEAVRADVTVTFVLPKRGFREPGAADYTGRVVVAEISVPRKLIERFVALWRAQEDR